MRCPPVAAGRKKPLLPKEGISLGRWPFLFVVGCGRSGTTLLRSMLDAHPDLSLSNEARFPVSMARTRARYERQGFLLDRFIDDLYDLPRARSRFVEWSIERGVLQDHLATETPQSLPEAVHSVYGLLASKEGKSFYGDKAPGYTLYMNHLAETYPGSKFVHIVRDGRDVAAAFFDAPFGPSTAPHAALYWRDRVRSARSAGQQVGPDRYLEVSYESLVDRPAEVLRNVCEFVGLEYCAEMLRYFEAADKLKADVGRMGHHESLQRSLTRGLRDWRSELPESSVHMFEVVAGDALTEFGYARAGGPNPSPAHRTALLRTAVPRGRFVLRRKAQSVKVGLGDTLLRRGVGIPSWQS